MIRIQPKRFIPQQQRSADKEPRRDKTQNESLGLWRQTQCLPHIANTGTCSCESPQFVGDTINDKSDTKKKNAGKGQTFPWFNQNQPCSK